MREVQVAQPIESKQPKLPDSVFRSKRMIIQCIKLYKASSKASPGSVCCGRLGSVQCSVSPRKSSDGCGN